MWLRPPARPVKPLHKHNKVVLPSSRFLIYFVIAGLWAFLWVLFAVFVHFPCVIVQLTLVSVACVLSATAVISLVCIPAVFLPAFQGSSRLFLCVASGLICGLVLCCLPTPQLDCLPHWMVSFWRKDLDSGQHLGLLPSWLIFLKIFCPYI